VTGKEKGKGGMSGINDSRRRFNRAKRDISIWALRTEDRRRVRGCLKEKKEEEGGRKGVSQKKKKRVKWFINKGKEKETKDKGVRGRGKARGSGQFSRLFGYREKTRGLLLIDESSWEKTGKRKRVKCRWGTVEGLENRPGMWGKKSK